MKLSRNILPIMALTSLMAAACAAFAQSVLEDTRLSVASATKDTPAIDILVKAPSEAPGNLVVVCLFHSEPANRLLASLADLNKKLGGKLNTVRTPSLFRGDLGETMLLTPKSGAIGAQRLLIVGLGDRTTFTPEREEQVGAVVYAEAERIGIKQVVFAPTVIDGGKTGLDTGAVSGDFLAGFLRGRDTVQQLHKAGLGPAPAVDRLTFLAGTTHALDTQKGLKAIYAKLTQH